MMSTDYCTIPEAAKILRVSSATVWRWINAGELPAFRVGQRKIRIKRNDLDHLIRPARDKKMRMTNEGIPAEPRSKRFKQKLLSFAGIWRDLDTERLIEEVYKARHEAPPSVSPKG